MDTTLTMAPEWVRVAVAAYQAIGPTGVIVLTCAGVVILFAWKLKSTDIRSGLGRVWYDITRAFAAVFDIHRRHKEAKIRVLDAQEALVGASLQQVDRRRPPLALAVDAEVEQTDRDDPRVSGTRPRPLP